MMENIDLLKQHFKLVLGHTRNLLLKAKVKDNILSFKNIKQGLLTKLVSNLNKIKGNDDNGDS